MTTVVDIQRAVFDTLGGFSGLSALIGARVYPDVAPEGVLPPYVAWQEIFLDQIRDLNGSAETNGLNNFRIQVSSWARGATGASIARAVDAQVRLAMIAATEFKSLLVDSRSLGFELDTKLFGHQSDFSIWMKS